MSTKEQQACQCPACLRADYHFENWNGYTRESYAAQKLRDFPGAARADNMRWRELEAVERCLQNCARQS